MKNQNVNLQSKLFEKLNSFSKLSVKLVFLGLLTPISVGLLTPISVGLLTPISVGLLTATSATSAFAAEPSYAYTTCYFKNSRRFWKWGLNSDNSWFVMSGRWVKNPDTGTWKFFTTTGRKQVDSSCFNARRYYQVEGKIDGIYAAMSNAGKNYDIVFE